MGSPGRIPMTAILAGGKGRRMGADKVVLPLDGIPLIERVWSRVAPVSEQVVVVGGEPRLDHLGVPTIPDLYPGKDSLGGIATALRYISEQAGMEPSALCVACDMPFLEPGLLRLLFALREGFDVVVPRVEAGYEPLCAVYRATCLPAMESQMGSGNLAVRQLFRSVRTREVFEEELRRADPDLRSFLNINRPADLEAARRILREGAEASAQFPTW